MQTCATHTGQQQFRIGSGNNSHNRRTGVLETCEAPKGPATRKLIIASGWRLQGQEVGRFSSGTMRATTRLGGEGPPKQKKNYLGKEIYHEEEPDWGGAHSDPIVDRTPPLNEHINDHGGSMK